MQKHNLGKLVVITLAFLLVFGLVGQSLVFVPGVHAQQSDADGDGIPDTDDRCPRSPGPRSNGGCPLPDSDGDGLPDDNDQCPRQAGPRSNNGCPTNNGSGSSDNNRASGGDQGLPPDSDGDGTPDTIDRCPDQPGDGANGGCPEGANEATAPEQPAISLIAMPTDGPCVVSPLGTSNVNIREYPLVLAPIIGTLQPNEFAQVLAILHNGTVLYAETEHSNQQGPAFLPPQPDPDDDYPTWVLIQDTDTDVQGWVAAGVVRFGGDCSEFDPPDDYSGEPYLRLKLDDVRANNHQTGDSAGDNHPDSIDILSWSWGAANNSFFDIEIFVIPGEDGDVVPMEQLSLNFTKIDFHYDRNTGDMFFDLRGNNDLPTVNSNEDGTTTVEYCVYEQVHEAGVYEKVCYQVEIPEGCVLTSSEAGVYTLDCDGQSVEVNPALQGMDMLSSPDFDNVVIPTHNDDGTTTVEYCVYEQVHEAGVYEEVCYQVEIPEGCVLTSSEAGVYTVECEDQTISVNPALQGINMLSSPDSEQPIIPTVNNNDDGTTTVEYCVYEQVHEAGVYEEVCYQVEIPEGCVLTSSEAGVYTLDCEDQSVEVNPALQGMGMLSSPDSEQPIIPTVTNNDDGTTTVEYCVYEQVHEAGVYEEVCYQVEVPEGCVLTSSEAGVYTLDCDDQSVEVNPALQGMDMLQSSTRNEPLPHTTNTNDDGSTTIEYCVYEQVHEAGVYEEVCYQIEVPENCTVTSSEAGVYHLDCEGEAEISLNPALDGLPAVDILAPDDPNDPLYIGLLLPGINSIRAVSER